MATDKQYNLDEDVKESFRFTIKGHTYEFRQLNTEEIDKFQNIKEEKAIREYLFSFITPVDASSPSFEDVSKQMLAPHWKNFVNMVRVELSGNGSN